MVLLTLAFLAIARFAPSGWWLTSARLAAGALSSVMAVAWLPRLQPTRERLPPRDWLIGLSLGYLVILLRWWWLAF